jgi:hypothetical protein
MQSPLNINDVLDVIYVHAEGGKHAKIRDNIAPKTNDYI